MKLYEIYTENEVVVVDCDNKRLPQVFKSHEDACDYIEMSLERHGTEFEDFEIVEDD